MQLPGDLFHSTRGAAAAELALLLPLLVLIMFGTMELGNLFLTQHALSKQVRDGARYASRLTLSADYACSADPADVFADYDETTVVNVTQRGTVDTSGTGRFNQDQWAAACAGDSVEVSVRCVPKGTTYTGIYAELPGDIPVVSVSADIDYQPILTNAIGFNNAGICLTANSEAAVIGL